jgi:murein DD-endopeptidase MepM/ murein hydrolase activator NlpD
LSTFKLVGSNLLTALATAAVTSMFWIAALSGGGERTGALARPADGLVAAPSRPVRIDPDDLVRGPTGLVIPVLGVKRSQLLDTFTQARSGGRVHDAIDIMAPAGTPVVAAAPGIVEKLFFSEGGGGITAYVRSEDGRWSYYYAHLRDYASGLREGQKLRQGDPIGSVGSTGNANPAGPHLHFAITRMEAGERWWQGTPINPYPLLAGK